MPACYIGLDIGTSGIRAIAIDDKLQPIAETTTPLPPPQHTSQGITQHPQIWWQATLHVLGELAPKIKHHQPTSLAIDGTSATLLAIDKAGQPLGDALMYNAASAPQLVATIASHAPTTSAAHGATSAAAKALQLLQWYPQTHRLLHQADWILGKLLGTFQYSDENNVLKLGYDPILRCWPDWIELAGIPLEKLPKPLPPGTPIGPISNIAARQSGLPAGITLVAGTTDSTASFLATGASQPGEAVTALGSTLVVKILSRQPVFAPEYGIYSHRLGDLWLAGGGSNSGGAVLLQHFTTDELIRLTPRIRPSEPTLLDYYPLPFIGERFPVNDPAMAPRIEPRPTDRGIFLQGLLEGMARIEQLGYQRLEQLGAEKASAIYTTGGGSKNPAWSEIRQHLLNIPFKAARHQQAVFGCALLAKESARHI